MKQVSGSLRIDLAQYRELAAFSQFGSDLDQATKNTLDRGAKMMEILKQGQYSPMPVEEEVAVLFFATKNYAKDIDIHEVAAKGNELITFLKDFYPNVLAKIREEKQLSDELTAQLDEAIKAFLSK